MSLPNDVRIGNIVEYGGPDARYEYIRILDISETKDGELVYLLQNPHEPEKSWKVSDKYLLGIYLQEKHLAFLEFEQNKDTGRFYKSGITISEFQYAEGPDLMNMSLLTKGFRILPPGFPLNASLRMVEANTIGPLYIHTLQNFCTDNNNTVLDFSKFK